MHAFRSVRRAWSTFSDPRDPVWASKDTIVLLVATAVAAAMLYAEAFFFNNTREAFFVDWAATSVFWAAVYLVAQDQYTKNKKSGGADEQLSWRVYRCSAIEQSMWLMFAVSAGSMIIGVSRTASLGSQLIIVSQIVFATQRKHPSRVRWFEYGIFVAAVIAAPVVCYFVDADVCTMAFAQVFIVSQIITIAQQKRFFGQRAEIAFYCVGFAATMFVPYEVIMRGMMCWTTVWAFHQTYLNWKFKQKSIERYSRKRDVWAFINFGVWVLFFSSSEVRDPWLQWIFFTRMMDVVVSFSILTYYQVRYRHRDS
jgi:hypothetical protein